MKSILLIIALCFTNLISAQDFLGTWHGKLDISGTILRLSLHITKTETGFSSTMDSPDQGAFGIPMTSTTFQDSELIVTSESMRVKMVFKNLNESLDGTFIQGGMSFPLVMTRNEVEKVVQNRPQEPKPKFNYDAKDVTFTNKTDNVTLAGTLTYPKGKGKFPVAILISGSGPQDRNEELLGHKPFLVIADYLTSNGIAVLRYDDRGTAESTGDFNNSTSEDFSRDVEAAIAFLKTQENIDTRKIGLIGHSEGGLIAPMVASKAENKVAFVIMLAGPGIPGSEILILQQELIATANGEPEKDIEDTKIWSKSVFEFMQKNMASANFDEDLKAHITNLNSSLSVELPDGMTEEELIETQISAINTNWMKFFLFFDPKEALEKVTCPILALNGVKDLQVPVKENLEAIDRNTTHNKQVKLVALPDLNHLFQHCETGSPDEYAKIEETFSPEVLEMMKNWILGLKQVTINKN